jgi:predicted esterase
LLILFTGAIAPGQPATRPATGAFTVTFDQRSELGLLPEMAGRFQWRRVSLSEPYDIKDETFAAYVPEPKPGQRYGLVVWINSDASGAPPKDWLPVLDKHHLIWIGANKSGNQVALARRFALAIDAAVNMQKRYDIDPARVYLFGLSGGGRSASRVGLVYPDVFRGVCPIVGCDYFRDVPLSDDPENEWIAQYREPRADELKLAKERTRFVFLTGEKDFNRGQTHDLEQAFREDGFKHTAYLEQPGMEHAIPNAVYFEKAVAALDEPPATRPAAVDKK